MNHYLQAEFGSGNIYEFSKEAKEGYTEYTSKTGSVSYRKYWDNGLIGVYKGVSIRDSQFGKQISIGIVNQNGDMCYLQLPLFDQRDSIQTFAEGFITYLPALQKDYIYRLFPYNIAPDLNKGEKYSKVGFSIKHVMNDFTTINGAHPVDRLTPTFTSKDTGEIVQGNIPQQHWKDGAGGNKVLDRLDKDKYLYEVLVAGSSESLGSGEKMKVDNNASAPQPITVPETAPTEQVATTSKVDAYTQEFNKEEVAAMTPNTAFDNPVPEVNISTEKAPVLTDKADKDDLPF